MTIKEVEALTGMTRANIRFYEAEGFIQPVRSSNGYREYSNQDVEVLRKVKLLRTLHMSLEEIKALHNGESRLIDSLDRHISKLESEKKEIEESQKICNQMRSDGVRYETLNAGYYLERIGRIAEGPAPELAEDEVPKVKAPWKRFFARSFDLMLYTNLWSIFLEYGFHVNMSRRGTWASFLDGAVALVLMFLFEPLMLRFWGTTPGKWLLGMHITDVDDRKLKIDEAQIRTGNVIWYGMGLNLPIYTLYRKWKCYQICMDGRMQEWEETSVIVQKEEKGWRIPVFVAVYILIPAFFAFTTYMAGMPKHRGDLTIEEFAENYNQLSKYHGLAGGELNNRGKLDEGGAWLEPAAGTIYINGFVPEPELTITETDGRVTEVEFSCYLKNDNAWPRDYREKMLVCTMAFVRARKECSPFSQEMKELLKYIEEHPFEDFCLNEYGVTLTCDVEYEGYKEFVGTLIPKDEEDYRNEYRFQFCMKLNE